MKHASFAIGVLIIGYAGSVSAADVWALLRTDLSPWAAEDPHPWDKDPSSSAEPSVLGFYKDFDQCEVAAHEQARLPAKDIEGSALLRTRSNHTLVVTGYTVATKTGTVAILYVCVLNQQLLPDKQLRP
jgi:hypothetical protein